MSAGIRSVTGRAHRFDRLNIKQRKEHVMKARIRQGIRQFQLKIKSYANSYYIDRIEKLEKVLARKPGWVQIDLIGIGEIPADAALLIRAVLIARLPKTRIITNARSSLQGSSVLVWLLGDVRLIRNDARLFFRDTDLSEEQQAEQVEVLKYSGPKYRDSYTESADPEEWDYVRVLQLINEFLPVKELVGCPIGVPLLRQFGLIENEKVDGFLAAAFSKSEPALAAG